MPAISATPIGPARKPTGPPSARRRGDWHGAAQLLDDLLVHGRPTCWPCSTATARLLPRRRCQPPHDPPARSGHRPGRIPPGLRCSACRPSASRSRVTTRRPSRRRGHARHQPGRRWALPAGPRPRCGATWPRASALHERESDWGDGNLSATHNWWHLALFHLERGPPRGPRDLQPRRSTPRGSPPPGVALKMLNASALLGAYHLDGHDTGDGFGAGRTASVSQGPSPWCTSFDEHLRAVASACPG